MVGWHGFGLGFGGRRLRGSNSRRNTHELKAPHRSSGFPGSRPRGGILRVRRLLLPGCDRPRPGRVSPGWLDGAHRTAVDSRPGNDGRGHRARNLAGTTRSDPRLRVGTRRRPVQDDGGGSLATDLSHGRRVRRRHGLGGHRPGRRCRGGARPVRRGQRRVRLAGDGWEDLRPGPLHPPGAQGGVEGESNRDAPPNGPHRVGGFRHPRSSVRPMGIFPRVLPSPSTSVSSTRAWAVSVWTTSTWSTSTPATRWSG
jgi:hypothetical protein